MNLLPQEKRIPLFYEAIAELGAGEDEIVTLKEKLHRRNMQIKDLKEQQCLYKEECTRQGKEELEYLNR